ncbi:MAG: SMP-30/gluconolactonase/LRE family protein, partial [Syntrophomonadaceae bacterium]|nr:SMP-30/gluconolactonase/LRE family protein [Syntrophomonadaceae bacterium]
NNANGLAFDTKGLLLAAEHEPGHVTRMREDGSIEIIASHYMGLRLNSPNDIAVRSDGTIYFTDPPYGLVNRKAELDFMGLYRINLKGELFLEAKYYHNPNGLAFSPDEKTLYLALTVAGEILALDVAENGATSNPRRFALVSRPDGITVDVVGNVYIAGVNGVEVFRWDGAYLGTIISERRPANCTFAGEDGRLLVITARDCLYSVRMPIPGF